MIFTANTYGIGSVVDLETDEAIQYVVQADSETGEIFRMNLDPGCPASPFIRERRRFAVIAVDGTELCRTPWFAPTFQVIENTAPSGAPPPERLAPIFGEEMMKLETWHSLEEKRRWKIVRTDDYTEVLGEIISADECTGECCIKVGGETKNLSFGPRGIRIAWRRR